jgi:hypothetical protein
VKYKTAILAALLIAGAAFFFFNTPRGNNVQHEQMAPGFEVVDAVSGKKLSSSDLKDKIIFVHFWASW